MAAFDLDFDATQVDTTDNYEILPAGDYVAKITESDIVDNKAGTGKILKLTWEMVGGDFEGRKVWQNVNFMHSNPKAQEIGQIELARICKAVGVPHLRDSEDLHHVPCMIKLKVKQDPGYDARNEVSKVMPLEGGTAPPPAAQQPRQTTTRSAPAAAQSQPRAATGNAPWRK